MTETQGLVHSGAETAPAVRLIGPEGAPLWGLTGAERLGRMARRLGLKADLWSEDEALEGRVALVRRDAAIGADVLAAFLEVESGVLLDEDSAGAVAAIAPAGRAREIAAWLQGARWLPHTRTLPLPPLRPRELIRGYDETLRKRRVRPVARLADAENRLRTEWALYNAADTGVTDAVTKYLWLYPAFHLAQAARLLRLPANVLTLAGIALALAAAALFAGGAFGWGLACAWATTLLDAADGKLARVTATSGRLGAALDDIADAAPPPLWYASWLAGLAATGRLHEPWLWIAALAIGGYGADLAVQRAFKARHRIDADLWRPFDSWFRLAAAGRNTALVLLTLFALAKMPYVAIASVAVWTMLTLGIRTVRLVQAGREAAKGRRVRSWMDR